MTRVFIIHKWGGNPNSDWYPWLRYNLEEKGIEVFAPSMPNTDEPEINAWVSKIKSVVGKVDEDTYFVGHSIGCQTIMRFLETQNNKAGGVVFVAPFFNLIPETTYEEAGAEEIAKPWLETPINKNKISKLSKYVCLFSEDDPYIPLSDSEIFREELNSKIIIFEDKGHFNEDAGIKKLPVALKELLRLVK